MEALLGTLGATGPVFVYTDFEKWRLLELAAHFPDLAPAIENVMGRLIDLFRLTRDHYAHPALNGSYSLKRVLPTIPGDLDHAALAEVRDGLSAQAAYHEAIDAGHFEAAPYRASLGAARLLPARHPRPGAARPLSGAPARVRRAGAPHAVVTLARHQRKAL